MSKILTFKLLTGEEVIGREIANLMPNAPYVRMEKVRTIGAQNVGNGQMGIGLMPFALSQHDGVITIMRSSIVAEFTVDERLEKVYLQQTSNIQLV